MNLRTLLTLSLVMMTVKVSMVRGRQSDGIEFKIPSNGTFNHLIDTDASYVYHMEADEFTKGNILFSFLSALFTTNGRTLTHLVAGDEHSTEYSEGIGSRAQFYHIMGFTHLQPTKLIIADTENNCIRLLNRTTGQTSHLAGICSSYDGGGYQDGKKAWYYKPRQIIKNQMKDHTVIIADSGNNAIRSLDLITGNTSTLVKLTRLAGPTNILQDVMTGDLYISSSHHVSKFHYADQYVSNIAGSSSDAFSEGSFSSARFDNPKAMLMLSKHKILLADQLNNRLRVLDLVTNRTSSICTGKNTHTYGSLSNCATSSPTSFLVIDETLYIGSYGAIEMIQGQSAKVPHWIGPVTPEQGGFCVDKTVTKMLKRGDTTVDVNIIPGIELTLGLGEHKFKMDKFSFKCTENIKVIEDAGVVRRLSFAATYDVKCSMVSGKNVLDTIVSVSDNNFAQLQTICHNECGKLETKKPATQCAGDILTITWFTNVTYSADVTKVPHDLEQRLVRRLSAQPILSIFLLDRQPPVVFPRKTSDGKYVEITLTSDCRDGKTYSAKDDTCA